MRARGIPIWGVKIHGDEVQAGGLPDNWYCIAGAFVVIELKSPTGHLCMEDGCKRCTRQRMVMTQIRAAGGKTFICRSVEQFDTIVRDVLKEQLE